MSTSIPDVRKENTQLAIIRMLVSLWLLIIFPLIIILGFIEFSLNTALVFLGFLVVLTVVPAIFTINHVHNLVW